MVNLPHQLILLFSLKAGENEDPEHCSEGQQVAPDEQPLTSSGDTHEKEPAEYDTKKADGESKITQDEPFTLSKTTHGEAAEYDNSGDGESKITQDEPSTVSKATHGEAMEYDNSGDGESKIAPDELEMTSEATHEDAAEYDTKL